MAYTIISMYNVNQAVGRGCPNRQTDVMLVQFFLAALNLSNIFPVSGFSSPIGSPEPIFPIDGVFKIGLVDWIAEFQRVANRNGVGPLAVDGRVDPSGVGWGDTNIKHTHRRTIQVLNVLLARSDIKRFESLPDHPSVPGVLRAELLSMRLTNSLRT